MSSLPADALPSCTTTYVRLCRAVVIVFRILPCRVGGDCRQSPPPSEPCLRLSPHTAQANRFPTLHFGTYLLMANPVNQFEVHECVIPSLSSWYTVVNFQFFFTV